MRLEYYPPEKFKNDLLTIIGKHLDLAKYKVFIFGSRVLNKGSDRSDIDVGIEGPTKIPAETFFEIEDEIENLPTLYTIELVDFHSIAAKFNEVAKEKIEYLN